MKKILLPAAVLCALAVLADAGAVKTSLRRAPFDPHERAAFFGGSIIHGGYYIHYLQLFQELRAPGSGARVLNAGASGDNTVGGYSRLGWDVLAMRPDSIFLMFGMNDVGRNNYADVNPSEKIKAVRAASLARYEKNLAKLADAVLAADRRLRIITPPPYDQYSDVNSSMLAACNEGLGKCAEICRRTAEARNVPVIELHEPLTKVLKANASRHFCKDRVHPGLEGHLLLAACVLESLEVSPTVASVAMDANGGSVAADNASVSNVKAAPGSLSFTYSPKSLPFPKLPEYVKDDEIYPLTSRFNREMLTVRNLPAGTYVLKADGREIGRFDAADFKKGVNIALLDTPSQRTAQSAAKFVPKLRDMTSNLRMVPLMNLHIAKKVTDFNDADACIAALDAWQEARKHRKDGPMNYYRKSIKAYKKLRPHLAEKTAECEKLYADLAASVKCVPFVISIEKEDAAAASRFPRATPESQGIRSAAVSEFVKRLDAEGDMVHAYMLIRHGKAVAEGCWAPYDAQVPHALYSISKAFTSMAIGFAVEDRKMSLGDRVDWFFPEFAPTNQSGYARELRVRDLMQMASGHRKDPLGVARATGETDLAKAYYSVPVLDPPGLFFRYMTGNSCMLARIHRRVTGEPDMIEYLRPRLFDKLGITEMHWDRQADGTVFGGSGFHLRAEDLAKVAQLLLQGGVWRGERLLPLWWVKQATSCQTPYGRVMDPVLALHLGAKDAKGDPDPDNDWQQGYGFQMWMGRHETFRLCGAYGQIGVVMPNEDIVCVVLAGGNGSNKLSVDALYDTILPSLSSAPLPEDPAALAALRKLSAGLSITLPVQKAQPSQLAQAAMGKTWVFPDNPRGLKSMKLAPGAEALEFENGLGRQSLPLGNGKWARGTVSTDEVSTKATGILPGGPQPVGAAGAWVAPDTFRIVMCYLGSPHIMSMELHFAEGKLAVVCDCPIARIDKLRIEGVPEGK